ncbi:LAMI_0G01068g1_1 [Lachancea mirantina]|uniref:Small ribosomal subunit protein uS10m n=1 Tax=Lachancea mirantina TaxID=1230905 RepID=A0A1G4K7B9_9SACH|nr:LAMI_0G01068g1_1 [Lachancea mirantina]
MFKRLGLFSERNFVRFSSSEAKNLSKTSAASKPEDALPINVTAIYHAPLKIPIKHGDLIADLQLRSYDNENLDFFSDFILRAGFYLGMPMTGPKPLPTRRERWTVIRSPFAQAKSKENFERHTHKRLIRVWDTNPEVVELWLSYITKHAIPGVGMKCNLFQKEGIRLCQDIKPSGLLSKPSESLSVDEAVGQKVLELLDDEAFRKHL